MENNCAFQESDALGKEIQKNMDKMKNIYLAQPNYLFGNTANLPYSVGVLAAAFSNETIAQNYISRTLYSYVKKYKKLCRKSKAHSLLVFPAICGILNTIRNLHNW